VVVNPGGEIHHGDAIPDEVPQRHKSTVAPQRQAHEMEVSAGFGDVNGVAAMRRHHP